MSHDDPTPRPDKRTLRRDILTARNELTAADVREAAEALAARALAMPEVARAHTVAAYVSVGAEPGTLALLDALRARGVRVLLPVLLPDNDLDWGSTPVRAVSRGCGTAGGWSCASPPVNASGRTR